MKCPQCHHPETRVIDSRPAEEGSALRRRRECEGCAARFTTYERVQAVPLIVVKSDGRREEFSQTKLLNGLVKACNKRPVSTQDLENATAGIERLLRGEGASEISTETIGAAVMDKLFALDQVAYVRFASVYQQFDDVRRFAQILERIPRRSRELRPSEPDGTHPIETDQHGLELEAGGSKVSN